jgi:chemotaxis protein CheX
MPADLSLEIVPDELAQIVESVFDTMLSLKTHGCGTAWFPSVDRLTSVVHLAGDWNGALLLDCDRRQACHFAGRFLSSEPSETVDDVVRDVLGELANMIGGNLKSMYARGIRVSLPSVVDGSDYSMRICGTEVRERLAFQCAEGVFWITILTTRS